MEAGDFRCQSFCGMEDSMERFFDMPTDFRVTKVKRDASQGVQDPHTHPYYEIFYLINGDCTFFINHNIYKLNQGDLVIIPKGEIHNSTYPEKGSSERFVISFVKYSQMADN